jgi:hypothetical protein
VAFPATLREVSGVRPRAAVAALALALVALAQGCGGSGAADGPPFEAGDIESPESLLISDSDIREAGYYTPYGTVLRWWQALQRGDVAGVQQSYLGRVSRAVAKRHVEGFAPRFSQPIDPEVRREGPKANMEARVRTAVPLPDNPDLISVRDFTTHFYMVATLAGYKLRAVSYRNYSRGREGSRLAVR